jgi:hypothetical protein
MPRSSSSKPTQTSKVSAPPLVVRNPYSSVATSLPSIVPTAPTFGQTLKEGFAFGTGSALAHRFFNPFPTTSIGTTNPIAASQSKKPCDAEQIEFEKCLKTQAMDTYCGNEQMAYTSCIQMTEKH